MSKQKPKSMSYSRKLKSEGRSSETFETQLAELSLEEVIGLKLELSAKELNGKLYGFPVWHSLPDIIKDAVVKFAISTTKTQGDAARMLGISPENFYKLKKRYKTEEYFLKKSQKKT
tara:strand:+ start:673 stop:1023 length:351 start_codon:yes stop_codon:yes gene_type:complete